MSQNDDRRPQAGDPERATDALSRDEARFVAKVAEAYAPPEPTPADRARFQARLEERLARPARRPLWQWLAPATVALLAAVLVTTQLRIGDLVTSTPTRIATQPDDVTIESEEETLLALVVDEPTSDETALPEDYQAIASLMY